MIKKMSRPTTQKTILFALFGLFCILLVSLSWSSIPYEQDQMEKAAKALHMAENGTYLSPNSNLEGHRDVLFSLYYIIYSLSISVLNLGPFLSGNIFTASLGIFSLLILCTIFYNNFGASILSTLFVVLNIPIFIITFTYSNEAALSLFFFLLSLHVLEYNTKYTYYLSGILFGASCFSRPDAVLLIPFWVAWQYVNSDYETVYKISKSIISLSVFGFIYSISVLGEIPLDAPTGFKWGGGLKLTGAMFVYSLGVPICIISLYGLYALLYKRKDLKSYSLLLTTIPAFFYIGNLSSPKYIIHLVIPISLFASIALQEMSLSYRYASVLFVILFWVFSVSPFGIKYGESGADWYLPTADGAIPTGAYAYFYAQPDSRTHKSEYIHTLNNAQKVVRYVEENEEPVTILGYFNQQALKYVSVLNGYDGIVPGLRQTLHVPENNSHTVMVRRSYLYGLRMTNELASQFVTWLEDGRVRSESCSDTPFPPLISIGSQIDKNSNKSLGERVLFLNKYTNGFSSIKSSEYIYNYRSLSWTKKQNVVRDSCNSKYSGREYYAYNCALDGASITRLTYPFRYTNFRHPQSVEEGYNELFYGSELP